MQTYASADSKMQTVGRSLIQLYLRVVGVEVRDETMTLNQRQHIGIVQHTIKAGAEDEELALAATNQVASKLLKCHTAELICVF